MEFVVIILVAAGAAMLTFFSGFGLGTILMPVFALFFPVEIAIALTAIVHLLNNVFKVGLIWKHINWRIAALFAIPAALAAIPGAILLNFLRSDEALYSYMLMGKQMEITTIKLTIGVLLIIFGILEFDQRFERFHFGRKSLPFGGLASGFFGGLSGHQGALRSLFLIRAGLTKEGFVATGIISAVLIDVSRLSVYSTSFFSNYFVEVANSYTLILLAIACLSAFIGSFFGRYFLKKVTFRSVQLIVGLMIFLMGILLAAGII